MRNHGGGIMEEASWGRKHGEECERMYHEGIVEESWGRNHGGGIIEASRTRNHGEESGSPLGW